MVLASIVVAVDPEVDIFVNGQLPEVKVRVYIILWALCNNNNFDIIIIFPSLKIVLSE